MKTSKEVLRLPQDAVADNFDVAVFQGTVVDRDALLTELEGGKVTFLLVPRAHVLSVSEDKSYSFVRNKLGRQQLK